MKQIVIIGAGASGLMAAIAAAACNASVTVLEQNEKPGKKLNATGNGKCNLTNTEPLADAWRGTHPEFVKDALGTFSIDDTLRFFTDLGLALVNKNGYCYPRCMQASVVTQLLTDRAQHLGVKLKTKEQVVKIRPLDRTSKHRYQVMTKGWQYDCDAVILACGSKASSISGADGSGYFLSEELGHRILPPFPALCSLKLDSKDHRIFSRWAGVRTEGQVTLFVDSIPVSRQEGELQLTEYGISGIPVFQLSRYAIDAQRKGKQPVLSIDFLPEIPVAKAKEFWEGRKQITEDLFLGLFPEKLAKLLRDQSTGTQLAKEWRFLVKDGMDFSKAQVCGGGVDTNQVNPKTMESLLHKELFFSGELLDIDGTCGGYNLQWAWSSGYTAGIYAAKEAQ